LYNWYAVNIGKLCPTGWHVPTDAEWTTLTTYLGGGSVAARKLKEAGTTHWPGPNAEANNKSGFTAIPNRPRSYNGKFKDDDYASFVPWWSSTETFPESAYNRSLSTKDDVLDRFGEGLKQNGFSVRCVKD
jgi:uncharacterized protein (TIGR02145 family)